MVGATAPLTASSGLLMLCFAASVLVLSVGNFVLYLILNAKGMRIPFLLSGLLFYPSFIYFTNRQRIGSKFLDILALSVIVSAPVAVLSALLLFPEMGGRQ